MRGQATFFLAHNVVTSDTNSGVTMEQLNVAEIDHEELFRIAARFAGDFLMTYDHAGELQELAEQYGFDTELVAMKNAHHAEMTEMLIGRNLDWARQTRTV